MQFKCALVGQIKDLMISLEFLLSRILELSQKRFLARCRITLLDITALTASLTCSQQISISVEAVNSLNPELNPICYLLALLKVK